MNTNQNRKKNFLAALYTTVCCGSVFLLLFLCQWTLPTTKPAVLETSMEVNLGNSETGIGTVAQEAPTQATEVLPNPSTEGIATAATTDESDEPIALPQKKQKPSKKNTQKKAVVTSTTTIVQRPKAVMKKLNNSGKRSNNTDSYNNITNQGIAANGNGDQGKPDGNPNSNNYTGGNNVTIRSGSIKGRRFRSLPSFHDEFNENAKVAVDIIVDNIGNVLQASINPRGTTTANTNIRSIALKKATQLKLSPNNEDEQSGTIVFNFILNK